MIGTKLAHYEITGHLGTGGMGEVYQATDSKLGRSVAVKLLPEAFARDAERVARFEREGRILASLNHPNIAAIHGLEESGGRKFLVMELVPGETLAQRISRGPVPIAGFLKIAQQICEALEAAHEQGVIHRDLKPANVKITPDGKVKVLDFGLAKAFESEPGNAVLSNSPTQSIAATNAGVILGTAAYMSPEQASGQIVDKRTDIWSFGVLVWEMLNGSRLFSGETTSHILADVLRREIDFSKLPTPTPAAIRTLLRRCLDRDLKSRLRDIGEARIAIENCGKEPDVQPTPVKSSRFTRIWTAVATVAAVAMGFAWYFHTTPEPARVLKMSILVPGKANQLADIPAVSPDGRRVAFTATTDGKTTLWVRDLGSLDAVALPGTEGASLPFWSHDSQFLGFFAYGKLKRTEAAGGPVQTLCDAPDGRGGTWNQNDVILFVPSIISPIFRVLAAGGIPVPVTTINEQEPGHRYPWFLPDGRHFLYTAYGPTPDKDMVFVADLDAESRRPLLAAASNVAYAAPGYLLFLRELSLMAQPFDANTLQTTGEAVPIAEQVGYMALDIRGFFSSSQNGVLVYDSARKSGVIGNSQLTWFDRYGKPNGTVGPPGGLAGAAISPNGASVASSRLDPQSGLMHIFLHDLVVGKDSRFTYNSQNNLQPVWSPDNVHLAFYSSPGGSSTVYQGTKGQPGQDEILDKSTSIRSAADWSSDGVYIIEQTRGDFKSGSDVWVLPLLPNQPASARKPFPYLNTIANESSPKLSPNGRWLAYESDETKRREIYVQTFPQPGGTSQVSSNGGRLPIWSRDGSEIFFIGADGKMMAVKVNPGPKFEAGTPKPLFDVRTSGTGESFEVPYDVAKDGRFLIAVPVDPVGQSETEPITVVLNWAAALKK